MLIIGPDDTNTFEKTLTEAKESGIYEPEQGGSNTW